MLTTPPVRQFTLLLLRVTAPLPAALLLKKLSFPTILACKVMQVICLTNSHRETALPAVLGPSLPGQKVLSPRDIVQSPRQEPIPP